MVVVGFVEITCGLNVRSNPKTRDIGAAYGYTQLLGGYNGGQAEFVHIPFANAGASLKIPNNINTDEQVLFLSDILPTGYFAADIANVQPGDDVAVFGAGPVGFFAVMSSFLRRAARVFSIDHWPKRLSRTKDLGAEIIKFDNEEPDDRIKKETNGKGAICIDVIGFEAVGHFAGNGNGGHIHNITGNESNNGSGKKGNNHLHHNHSTVSNPTYNSVNSLQVLAWRRLQKNIQLYQYQEYIVLAMTNFR